MLVVDNNLKAKDIRGKRYHSSAFGLSVTISIPFFVAAVYSSASVPPREGRVAIIVLFIIVWMAVPAALLLGTRKVSYIIGDDKLYFFNAKVKCFQNVSHKNKCVRTNGSICYSDINDFRYSGIEFEGHPRKKYITPPRVVLIGNGFEVEIYAYKSLINRIRELNRIQS